MYKDLPLSDRARIIRMAVQSGISDLRTIEDVYNKFAEGGPVVPDNIVPNNGEITQGKPFTKVQKYFNNLPNLQRRLRKAGTLAFDLARVVPYTSLATDVYDIVKNNEGDIEGTATGIGAFGKIGDIMGNTITQAADDTFKFGDLLKTTIIGEALSFPDKISDSIQFIRDFTKPIDSFATGGDLEESNSEFIEPTLLESYKNGGRIHIKKENRGKFTALKKRTGHSASWFKAHGTPAQRKMATFALNARKWHH